MTDKKTEPTDITFDMRLADAQFRLTTLEQTLLKKGIITEEELTQTAEALVEKLTKVLTDKLNDSKSLDDFIANLARVGPAKN